MSMDSDRILTSGVHREDGEIETSLRPRSLRDYVGQTSVKDSLSIYIKAALARRDTEAAERLMHEHLDNVQAGLQFERELPGSDLSMALSS